MAESASRASDLQDTAINEFRQHYRKFASNTAMPGVFITHEVAKIVNIAEDSVFKLIEDLKDLSNEGEYRYAPMRTIRKHLSEIERCLLSGEGITPSASTADALQLGITRIKDQLLTSLSDGRPPSNSAINKGGRPRKWNWEGVLIHLIAVANKPDGLPDEKGAQAQIGELMADWFAANYDGDAPAESEIKKRAKLIMAEVRR